MGTFLYFPWWLGLVKLHQPTMFIINSKEDTNKQKRVTNQKKKEKRKKKEKIRFPLQIVLLFLSWTFAVYILYNIYRIKGFCFSSILVMLILVLKGSFYVFC